MRVLMTGFKPFNNEKTNSSEYLVQNYTNPAINLKKIILNVEYDKDAEKTINIIKDFKPDLVLMFGLAAERKYITMEYLALNIKNASIKDNAGIKFENLIDKNNLVLTTNLDIINIYNKLNNNKIKISYNAGTFVCNDLYYKVLNYIYKNDLKTKCLFIHLPYNEMETSKNNNFIAKEEQLRLIDDIVNKILE